MRPIVIATLLVLLGASGVVSADKKGEETFALDLSMIPGGSTYFLKCSRGAEPTNCGLATLWEQANGHPGLQSSIFAYGGRAIDPDLKLLV